MVEKKKSETNELQSRGGGEAGLEWERRYLLIRKDVSALSD